MKTARGTALGGRRLLSGYLLALLLPALSTVLLVPARGSLNLSSDVLVFLLGSVVVALVGGLGPAVVSALVGSMLLNWFFTPPVHTLGVTDPNNVLTLIVFVTVAVLVSSAVDLAARRTHEAARAAAEAAALAQVDRTRTALLAAVGHDLRTPLAAAKAAISTLRSIDLDLVDADRDELLATADESLDRLAALVENLLDMSRLQAGAMAVVLARRSPWRRWWRGPSTTSATTRRGSGWTCRPTSPRSLADPGLLERVLANLVANALRFSPTRCGPAAGGDGTRRPRGDARGRPGTRHPRRPARPVFLPFQRLGDTDNTTGDRARARAVPRARRGDGRHARPRGHPGRRADHGPVAPTAATEQAPAARAARARRGRGPMTRVLVVDDEPQILRALAINLRARGYDVQRPAPAPTRSPRQPRTSPSWWCSTSACRTWTAPR